MRPQLRRQQKWSNKAEGLAEPTFWILLMEDTGICSIGLRPTFSRPFWSSTFNSINLCVRHFLQWCHSRRLTSLSSRSFRSPACSQSLEQHFLNHNRLLTGSSVSLLTHPSFPFPGGVLLFSKAYSGSSVPIFKGIMVEMLTFCAMHPSNWFINGCHFLLYLKRSIKMSVYLIDRGGARCVNQLFGRCKRRRLRSVDETTADVDEIRGKYININRITV